MLVGFTFEKNILHFENSNQQFQQSLLHTHPTYEFYYFVCGDVLYSYHGHHFALKPHTFLLIHPNVQHGCKVLTSNDYVRFKFQIEEKYFFNHNIKLLNMLEQRIDPEFPVFELSANSGVMGIMDSYLKCDHFSDVQKTEMLSDLVGSILFNLLFQKTISYQEYAYPIWANGANSSKVRQIIYWLNSNLKKELSVDQLAKQFYFSKTTLNRNFKATTGLSVRDYIRKLRITLAKQLIDEGVPITTAATEAGFKDYSTFYRSYRAIMGEPPSHKR